MSTRTPTPSTTTPTSQECQDCALAHRVPRPLWLQGPQFFVMCGSALPLADHERTKRRFFPFPFSPYPHRTPLFHHSTFPSSGWATGPRRRVFADCVLSLWSHSSECAGDEG